MQRKLEKKGKIYIITFDEYETLDTVECNGKFLSTKNAVVKQIVNHADSIRYGNIPQGFNKVRG